MFSLTLVVATPLMATLLRRRGTRPTLWLAAGFVVLWRRRISRLGQQHAEVPGSEEAGLHPSGRP
ncbi:hypothetical protein B7P34_00360 [Streptosporangium nondiastaticum]|uniref:Uncharacterized protein n=1 Tax=Streptosporangium nondiastaticum TaxID=35764 RepID=A0A9X7JV48_9ACTN|nr:hypothetical protein [Streptosporangium nondiastaticum]PSJ30513.1 hypothetical protein B7P34_00360 [Streptosporangium nondiastaticum]